MEKVWCADKGKFISKRHYNRILRKPYVQFQKEVLKIRNTIPRSQANTLYNNVVVVSDCSNNTQFNNISSDHNEFDFENAVNNSFILDQTADDRNDVLPVGNEITAAFLEECVRQPERSFSNIIRNWMLTFRISHTAATAILKVLHEKHPELPKTSRCLLNTIQKIRVEKLEPGIYHYLGIANQLEKLVLQGFHPLHNIFELSVNLDGLPLFKSSNKGFWPILGSINNRVFLIATYYGPKKPIKVNAFLEDFVYECSALINGELQINGQIYKLKLTQIMADLPAKSYILCIKSHTGYHSCTKCVTNGSYINNRMCFPDLNERLRTAADFICQTDLDHHKDETILTDLPDFDIINNVPIDYMHCICLGVTKKLIALWSCGPICTRIGTSAFEEISSKLNAIREFCPSDFQRRPRSITEYKLWKSVEFRQFLLYTGPFVLKNVLQKKSYDNFLLLHTAVRILCNPNQMNEEHISFADKLLRKFVIGFTKIYGNEFVSMNIHALVHLANDTRTYGPLDMFSCFKFENFLFTVKQLIRSPYRPLHQLVARLQEINYCSSYHLDGIDNEDILKLKCGLSISLRKRDKYVELNCGTMVELSEILRDEETIRGYPFSKKDLYEQPFLSRNVGVFVLKKSNQIQSYNIKDITHKLYVAPYKSNLWMGVRLLHHQY